MRALSTAMSGARRLPSMLTSRYMSLKVPIYQLDAFSSKLFGGNPAAVLTLDEWLPDEKLMAIAAENNLAETAFTVPLPDGGYHLRWFTPTLEVDMCGHATLATAALILGKLQPKTNEVAFQTKSGELRVRRHTDPGRLTLDFPLNPVGEKLAASSALVDAVGAPPVEVFDIPPLHGAPWRLFVYDDEATVAGLAPRLDAMDANVSATARSSQPGVDFVSRFFGPLSGIPEDPVTGSAHTTLAPFWATRLGKSAMEARQLSQRGGELHVELSGERVLISGSSAFYMEGHAFVSD